VKLANSVLVLASLAVLRVGAASISIQPADLGVAAGGTFSLNVDALNVVDLYAFQFDIGFTPGLLSATSVTEGGLLPGAGSTFFIPGTIDNVAGTILFSAGTLIGNIPGENGTGTLATISFNTLSSGTSLITLSNSILLNSALLTMDADQTSGSVTVGTGAVPEPANYTLFAALIFASTLTCRAVSAARTYRKKKRENQQ
jgi:hypothetical protein